MRLKRLSPHSLKGTSEKFLQKNLSNRWQKWHFLRAKNTRRTTFISSTFLWLTVYIVLPQSMSRFENFESSWTREKLSIWTLISESFLYYHLVKYLLWNIDGVVHVLFFKKMNQLDGLADRRVDRSAPFGMSSFAEDQGHLEFVVQDLDQVIRDRRKDFQRHWFSVRKKLIAW